MATVATLHIPSGSGSPVDTDFPNTLPDPRTPSPKPQMQSESDDVDLSGEVAALSTKLINAINHSTGLDDSLHHVRAELEAAKRRIQELERENMNHVKDIADGVLLKKAEVDANMQKLRSEMDQARRERETADKAKKQMEVELESLTASLFEQANTMVADARRENEAAERRNAQLRAQLGDTETLLSSQQEQLQDLKSVMEKMSMERDETETATHRSTAPSTPATDSNKMSRILEALPLSPGMHGELQPDHPLHFAHLISTAVRYDTQSYNDFSDLLKTSRAINQIYHSRSSSGNIATTRAPSAITSNSAASTSSPHLPGSFNSPVTPSVTSPRDGQSSPLPPLKDSKFFKRSLTEDIEPTLRLDLAPGLSWLARRTVLTSITAGALVIEPFASTSKLYGPVYSCTLCGEDRRQDAYVRRHRFRTSEDPSAQRHPLCEYCLTRLRATCDFASFLRMCRDGLWKAANEDEIRTAWDEAVRLRERMFWARIGGGVIPTALKEMQAQNEAIKDKARKSAESAGSRERVSGESSQADAGDEDGTLAVRKPNPTVRLSTPPHKTSPSLPPPVNEKGSDADRETTPIREKGDALNEAIDRAEATA